MYSKLKGTIENYMRVLRIARKPDTEEFSLTAKVCAIGVGFIGVIGFILFIISAFFIG